MAGGSNPPSATSPDLPFDELAAAVADGADALAVPEGVPIVLAVSGGPDSMALLYGAHRAAPARGWVLRVGHLDHALRDGSADDARFVADAAAELGVPCDVSRVDVAAEARRGGASLEEAGRDARYRFLESVAAAAGESSLIFTAHTADDAAETVLINLLRGSGLSGARGIPARRGRIARPMLGQRRRTLRSALDAAHLAYRLDPTNDDAAYLRNRVRAELVPLLERLRPSAIDALGRYARLAADDDELLDAIAAAELARRTDAGDGSIDWRRPPPRALGRRVMRLAVGRPTISAERIEALLAAAEGPRGGLVVELGGGRGASVHERRIRFTPTVQR